MLKVQHIPRSVGNMVKMAEHGTETPFQLHILIIPEKNDS